MSVSRAAEVGNMVLFNVDRESLVRYLNSGITDPNVIYNKKSGDHVAMTQNKGRYEYPLYIKKKVQKEAVNEGLGEAQSPPESGEFRRPDKKGKIKWNSQNTISKCEGDCEGCPRHSPQYQWDPF